VKMNAHRLLAGSIMVAMMSMVLTGCDVARAGARCRPNGAWGRDSTFVLHCQNGRWVRTITIARFAQILSRNAASATTTTVAPPTEKLVPTSTTTTSSTTTSTTTTSTTTTTVKAAHYVSLDHVTTYVASVPDWTDAVPGDWAPASDDDFRIIAPGADDCANDGDVTPQFAASVDDTGTLQLTLTLRWTEDPMGDGPQGQWRCAMAPQVALALYASTDPDAAMLGSADVNFDSDLTN
jgi:hypothetical protein